MTSFFAQRLVGVAVCALVIFPLACREDPEPPEPIGGGGSGGSGGRGGSGGGRGGTGVPMGGSGGSAGGAGGSATDAPAGTQPTDGPVGDGGAGDAPAGDRPPGEAGAATAMRPFFSHPMAYPAGTIRPSNCAPAGTDAGAPDAGGTCAQSTLDQAVMAFYEKWRTAYVKNITSGACTGFSYIDAPPEFGTQQAVSSLQGMGMLITVVMATGQDTRAQSTFDGLFKYVRRFKSTKNPKLMSRDVPGGCPAMIANAESQTDGDLDIALSLLMADRQWGSTGTINYLNEARDIIGAIKASEMSPMGLPTLGDWVAAGQPVGDGGVPPDPKFSTGLRSTDLMPGHFRAFSAITSDAFWMGAIDASHSVLKAVQDNHSPETGLVPDFIINVNTTPAPAPDNWSGGNGDTDGDYGYTAARMPFRIAADYITSSGEPAARAKMILTRLNDWISTTKTMGNPAMIRDGYTLDDEDDLGTSGSYLFEGAFGAAAVIDAKYQAWLDRIWNRVSAGNTVMPADSHTDSVRLLSLILMSGNWWAP